MTARSEDALAGGQVKVLRERLEKEGLPEEAGLTGLLRHLDGNRAISEGVGLMIVQTQSEKLVALRDLVCSLWLYTSQYTWAQLTTSQKELFADVVDAMQAREYEGSFEPIDRWWRG